MGDTADRKKVEARGITPRISESVHNFMEQVFGKKTTGAEIVLESFPTLYYMTLDLEIAERFTKKELLVIAEAMNVPSMINNHVGQKLWAKIFDGIRMRRLHTKYEIDHKALQEKIEGMTVFQTAALEIWATSLWTSGKYKDELLFMSEIEDLAKEE